MLIIALIWTGFATTRYLNWSWGYASRVEQKICDMVKPEYLMNPSLC
jgi:hypothetical protein